MFLNLDLSAKIKALIVTSISSIYNTDIKACSLHFYLFIFYFRHYITVQNCTCTMSCPLVT